MTLLQLTDGGLQALQVTYQGAATPARLTAELLRLESPAANAQAQLHDGQVVRPLLVQPAHIGRHVNTGCAQVRVRRPWLEIQHVKPVGSYAVQISFSDGHSHGIYSFEALAALSAHKFERMRHHVQAIQQSRAEVQAFRSRHTRRDSANTQ